MPDLKLSLIITADGKVAVQGVREVNAEIAKTGPAAKRAENEANASFLGMEGGATKVGSAIRGMLAGFSVAFLVKELFSVNAAFESLRASLHTVTGSADLAAKAFEGIQTFAAKTPFSVREVTDAFIALQARGLEPSERALISYGNTAGGLSKSIKQMIEAVADATTGEFERLKEFGIKARKEGEQVTFTFKGLSTQVANDATSIQNYLIRLGETDFAGGMERQANTMKGALSNLGDAWDALLDTILGGSAENAIAEWVRSGAAALDWMKGTAIPTFQAVFVAGLATIEIAWERLSSSVQEIWIQIQGHGEIALNAIIRLSADAIAMMASGWVSLQGVVEVVWVSIKSAAGAAIEWISGVMAEFISSTAAGLEWLGATETANSMQRMAAALGPAEKGFSDLDAKIKAVTASTAQRLAQIETDRTKTLEQSGAIKTVGMALQDLNTKLDDHRAKTDQRIKNIDQAAEATVKAIAVDERLSASLDDVVSKLTKSGKATETNTGSTNANTAAKRAQTKEIQDYEKELARVIRQEEDFIEQQTKLAAQYGSSAAMAALYEKQVKEVTAAMVALGATTDEIRAAQQRLWEEMSADGKAAVKIREANEKTAKDVRDAWQRASDDINRSLTDALLRGFESGKGFAENLIDTLKNMFNTLVLRPIIQAAIAPVSGGIAGMMPGAASAGNAGSLLGLGSPLYSGISTGFGMSIANIGAAGYLGAMVPSFAAAGAAFGQGAIGTAIGLVAPYLLPLIGLTALLPRLFGGRGDETPDLNIWGTQSTDVSTAWDYGNKDVLGGGGYESGLGRLRYTTQHNAFNDEAAALAFQQYMQGFGLAEDVIAQAVGKEISETVSNALQAAGAHMKIEDPKNWTGNIADFFKERFTLIFDTIGGDLDKLFDTFSGEIDFSDSQQVAQLTASITVINSATGDLGTALRSLADPLQTSFTAIQQLAQEGEVLPATMVRLGAQLVATNSIFDALGVTMLPLNQLGAEAANSLIQLAGGIDKLTAASNFFYENFYTEEERRAHIIELTSAAIADFNEQFKDTIAATGAVTDGVIDTKAELRAFVEALDMTTEAGQQAFIAAMALAPTLVANANALAALAQAAGASANAVNAAADAMDARVRAREAFGDRFREPGRYGPGTPGKEPPATTGTSPGIPNIGSWRPDEGPSTGTGTTAGQTIEDFLSSVQDTIDQLTLPEHELALKAIAAEIGTLREQAEALGFGPEAQAAIDQLEALRLAHLAEAEAAAEAARALEQSNFLANIQDAIDQLNMDDFEYAVLRLQHEMEALRAQAEALGLDTALIDQLEALRLAALAAAQAQAEADEQYSALEATYEGLLDQLDALVDATEQYAEAMADVRFAIDDAIFSIKRQQTGWNEAAYQAEQVAKLKQQLDQTTGLAQIAVARQLQAAIVAQYAAQRAVIEAQGQDLETQTTAIQDQRAQLAALQSEEMERFRQLREMAKGLRQYIDSLNLSALSPLTNAQRLAEAKRQYKDLLQRAQMGDTDAAGQLQGAASSYLGEARNYYASSPAYTAIFASVTDSLSLLAQSMDEAMGPSTAEYQQQDIELSEQQAEIDRQIADLQADAIDELQALQELLTQLEIENALAAEEKAEELRASLDNIGGQVEAMSDQISTNLYAGFTGLISQGQQSLAKFDALIAAVDANTAARLYAAQAGANTGAMA